MPTSTLEWVAFACSYAIVGFMLCLLAWGIYNMHRDSIRFKKSMKEDQARMDAMMSSGTVPHAGFHEEEGVSDAEFEKYCRKLKKKYR